MLQDYTKEGKTGIITLKDVDHEVIQVIIRVRVVILRWYSYWSYGDLRLLKDPPDFYKIEQVRPN